MNGRARRFAVGSAGVAIIALGVAALILRLSLEGRSAMVRSDSEFDAGHLRESLLYARRAAALYAPGARHIERADARLEAIAKGAEATMRRDVAVLAWQAIRTTEEQRRWWIGRPSDRARRADDRLAQLLADDERYGSIGDQQQLARRIQVELEARRVRRTGLDLLQTLALAAIGCGTASIGASLGRLSKQRWWFPVGVTMTAVGAIAWAILLSLA